MIRTLNYVGCKGVHREVFRYKGIPTHETHGHLYAAVIGPFRTRRAAEYMAQHGLNNPCLQHVADAERITKHLYEQERFIQRGKEQA